MGLDPIRSPTTTTPAQHQVHGARQRGGHGHPHAVDDAARRTRVQRGRGACSTTPTAACSPAGPSSPSATPITVSGATSSSSSTSTCRTAPASSSATASTTTTGESTPTRLGHQAQPVHHARHRRALRVSLVHADSGQLLAGGVHSPHRRRRLPDRRLPDGAAVVTPVRFRARTPISRLWQATRRGCAGWARGSTTSVTSTATTTRPTSSRRDSTSGSEPGRRRREGIPCGDSILLTVCLTMAVAVPLSRGHVRHGPDRAGPRSRFLQPGV